MSIQHYANSKGNWLKTNFSKVKQSYESTLILNNCEKKHTNFYSYKIPNPVENRFLDFSRSNNTKHLALSQTLINPCTLSNLMRNGFSPIKVLYEML